MESAINLSPQQCAHHLCGGLGEPPCHNIEIHCLIFLNFLSPETVHEQCRQCHYSTIMMYNNVQCQYTSFFLFICNNNMDQYRNKVQYYCEITTFTSFPCDISPHHPLISDKRRFDKLILHLSASLQCLLM